MEKIIWTKINEILIGKKTNKTINLRGWIYRTRSSGNIVFSIIRDSSGIIQATIIKENLTDNEFENAKKALIESSIEIKGEVKEDKRAPGGYEIHVTNFNVINFAEPFPIVKDQSPEFLLDQRHLWIRSQHLTSILKVRSTIVGAIHNFFRKRGYYEFDAPILQPNQCEGGSTLFEVKYYKNKTFLSQSWQLYAEAMVMTLGKIYTIAPNFRAEKSRTTRHITEFWDAEMEVAWAGMDDILEHAENVVSYACQNVADKNVDDFEILGVDINDLKVVKPPFPRITYADVLEKLKMAGIEIEWGKDLRTLEERELTKDTKIPIIVTHYPRISQAFYKARDPIKSETVLAFDVIAPNVGELIGGSEREENIEILKENLRQLGEDPEKYEWYFDTRRYGSVRHSGFGMGMERLIQYICKLDHIRDAIPFPRTPARYSP